MIGPLILIGIGAVRVLAAIEDGREDPDHEDQRGNGCDREYGLAYPHERTLFRLRLPRGHEGGRREGGAVRIVHCYDRIDPTHRMPGNYSAIEGEAGEPGRYPQLIRVE
ncbi:hypothetical protein JMUB6875_32980 [Nocardia sp. JMUB6875]